MVRISFCAAPFAAAAKLQIYSPVMADITHIKDTLQAVKKLSLAHSRAFTPPSRAAPQKASCVEYKSTNLVQRQTGAATNLM